MKTFLHLVFRCDLGLRSISPTIALCTLSYNGDHLCQVISKIFSGLKVMENADIYLVQKMVLHSIDILRCMLVLNMPKSNGNN
jgi:hypothetical protein